MDYLRGRRERVFTEEEMSHLVAAPSGPEEELLRSEEVRRRPGLARTLLELVNLPDKADVYVDSLSRGMKQRLALARCLVHDPRVLILDEPASGLDPRARAEMKEIIRHLKQLDKTVLISSHILPQRLYGGGGCFRPHHQLLTAKGRRN